MADSPSPPLKTTGTLDKPAARTGKVRACAECKRLKLRCDKTFPCRACIRRGCSTICPDKTFTDRATPSSLKATSLRSRREIEVLKARVAALEEALAVAHPAHPLLNLGDSPSSLGTTGEETDTAVEETVDILGTLSMAEDGSTVYHGATSLSEHFLLKSSSASEDSGARVVTDQPELPGNLQLLSVLFPFPPSAVASASDPNEFLSFLPTAADALEVTNQYWHHFSHGSAPISRHQFMKHIYARFYSLNATTTLLERSDAHRLGVLFITLALGILSDLSIPMQSTRAETYHQLARAALCLDPVCDNTTIYALQCMLSIIWYMRSAPTRTSTGYRWAFNGILLKLAISVGIFRDSTSWLVDLDEIEQREVVCWELICSEFWQAFISGRPCSLDMTMVDCQRPPESAPGCADLRGFIPGYRDWRFRFFALINDALLVVLRPGMVKYSEVLKVERKLRDCVMPEGLETPLHGSPLSGVPDSATTIHIQRFTALMVRETACCLLHRRFLVLAMQQKPDDPTKDTPFKYSAFQAGHCACWIVNAHVMVYRRYPELVSRTPIFWSMSFSAAVILGAIAARYWDRDFARCVLAPFEIICWLFKETVGTSIQPSHAMERLQRLHQRVRSQFPPSGLSDSLKNLDDLPLLGVQPQRTLSPSERSQRASDTTEVPAHYFDANVTSEPLNVFPGDERTSNFVSDQGDIGELPDAMAWPMPNLNFSPEDHHGRIPSLWPNDGQEWHPPLLDSISNSAPETSASGPANAEVGQWDQFLDNLGLWEA